MIYSSHYSADMRDIRYHAAQRREEIRLSLHSLIIAKRKYEHFEEASHRSPLFGALIVSICTKETEERKTKRTRRCEMEINASE